jgi:multicomponent Na+:H+ antiporter subunit E
MLPGCANQNNLTDFLSRRNIKGDSMKLFKNSILFFLFLMIFWLLLTSLDIQEVIAGIIISFIITILLARKFTVYSEVTISIRAIIFAVRYIFVFTLELIKSNLDVAFRVLNPQLPIKPGIVKVKTNLRSRLGRIILANSITLTPGTLTVEIREDNYYIHWIDVTTEDIERSTEIIVRKFEKYLEVIFG